VQCVCKCAEENSATVRVKECRFERNTECKSETLGFVGLYWVELSVCIIPPLIYNLLPPWTYPVLGNHVKSACLCFICVCFRSSMHNTYLFRSVVKDFWDEICFRFWNICEETSGIFSEFSEMEKVVVHGSEELLHSCCAGEVYCNTTATVFRSVQGSYV